MKSKKQHREDENNENIDNTSLKSLESKFKGKRIVYFEKPSSS